MSSLTTVEHDQLATVHGGAELPDLTGAIQAGNSAAPTWTAGGAIIGPGAKAVHSAFTREMAGAGWLYEAGRNLCGQEGWKWCAPAAKADK
jgi:hypothetical protein